jgi:uncharacterized membrane protein
MSARPPDPFAVVYPEPRRIGYAAPFAWLRSGATDLMRAPLESLFYGAMLAAMGYALVRYAGDGAIGLALLTGFLLVGPLLATGLYAISRAHEQHGRAEFRASLVAWSANLTSFSFFGAILALLLAVWIRISIVVVAIFFDGPMPRFQTLLADILVLDDGLAFLAVYASAGFGFALLVFSAAVVSLPMLLDRPRCDTMTAIVTSLRALAKNPGPLALWAALIVLLTVIGFALWFVALVPILPILGHGTWHAYRALIEPAPAVPNA